MVNKLSGREVDIMDKNFFSADDLAELNESLKEMEASEVKGDKDEDPEVAASARRFKEIIEKHREEGWGAA